MTTQIITWIREEFKVEVSEWTVTRLLREYRLNNRKMQHKTSGYSYSMEEMGAILKTFTESNRGRILGHKDWKNVYSIDFTYTGHRTDVIKSWGRRGGTKLKQVKKSEKKVLI